MNYPKNFSSQSARPTPNNDNKVNEARIKKVLDGDAAEMNKYANELAEYYLPGKENEKLSTSQIRNFLDEIQKMKEFSANKLQLLRPKLAYAAGRHKGRVRDFRDLIEKLIEKTNKDNFDHFKNFVEAIVAYHRFHGGK
ncbi:MAG TPA: type III-A CRISPR-associated protein Csm2 [Candidatus Aminicenantes bacterium]|nr:MAG: type III-A CRISPR-associated protein Csm2 [Candidatus Aminicenantes bacterium]HEK86298.1 type III-A CRISPR-associated protein Csm2 [Candidatus Aminicenantes bacterium]